MSVGWLAVVVCVVTHCWPSAVDGSSCPWLEEGLSRWSDSDTWGSAGVPATDSEVTIPAGKRVLLDVQPASLTSLTIEEGAALIWGDVDGLELNTHYIWVKGEFLIGSRYCKFKKEAKIRLHGTVNDDFEVTDHGFGRKFIGVAPGATLEMHGKLKTPWTKLAQTVRPIKDVDCAVIYDHTNFEHNKARLTSPNGLNVLVWNQDGSFMDFNSFKTYELFADFFETIPEGKVVAMYAYGDDGIGTKKDSLEDTIVSLGGTKIKDAPNKAKYSFIGRKGSPDTVKEVVNSGSDGSADFLNLDDRKRELVFQVALSHETVKQTTMFRVLHFDAAYPKLTLVNQVQGWKAGDEVLLTSTDFDWEQAETRRIVGCRNCTSRQIRVDAPLTYLHYGNFTYHVDERGEVAMLTRNIVVEGVMESACTERTIKEKSLQLCTKFGKDMFGGHLKVIKGFKAAHIRRVKFQRMGQQINPGKYPIHFHMCDDVTDAYVRENVVFDSRSRCITIHGTNKLKVSDNVCYLHHGHGLFLEDAVEQENIISGNLIVGTKHGIQFLTDMDKAWCSSTVKDYCEALSSYWLTHPNNIVKNNVAAGGDGIGYMYVFADLPLGSCRQRELNRRHHPKDMPLFFTGNVAHSYRDSGLHVDEKLSTGTGIEKRGIVPENGLLKIENEYNPHVNGKPVWVDMSKGTFYKNGNKNVWVKGGNIRLSYTAFADSKRSFTGGTTLTETGTEVYKCIFIGETDNKGEPSRKTVNGVQLQVDRSYAGFLTDPLTATSIYQGPIFVNSCFFDQYKPTSWCLDQTKTVSQCKSRDVVTRDAGAISFKRGNTYPTMTSTYAVNNTFGFCDDPAKGLHWVYQGLASMPAWEFKDGNKAPYLLDKDGKLTGTVNASIVANFPLFSGDECQQRPGWNLQVCPYRYVKMEVKGYEGNLSPANKKKYPMIIQRDDSPYDEPYIWMGEIRNEYMLRTHRSYILDFNKNLDNAAFPRQIRVFGYGVEKGDVVRVGICQPRDVIGFDIRMFYPVYIKKNATWVDNLAALDADTTGAAFFHDKRNGILFFKMLSFHHDTNETQQCPDGHCFHLIITPQGGTRSNLRSCRNLKIDSYKDKTPIPVKPQTPRCPGIAKPEGLGPTDWGNVGFIEYEEFTVPCKGYDTLERNALPEYKGCYNEKVKKDEQELRSKEALFLQQTMTVNLCVDRCYHRRYKFAGLSRGWRCTCSNSLLESSDFRAKSWLCGQTCQGDSGQRCGGSQQISVWTTGL